VSARLAAVGLVAAALLALAPDAWAATEEHAGPSWSLLALQILNTAILLAILVRVVRRPLAEFLQQRSRGIAKRIEDAQVALRNAQAELAQSRERLERYDQEAAEIMQRVEEQAQAERQHTLERAEHAAERIRAEARAVADQEIERARRELRSEAAELAVQLAAEILAEKLNPEDDRRLVQEFAERVGESS
jgi:F-type H+-transporting ATPase subunit b